MKSKRVIIDTNLWISFLISNKLNDLDPLIEARKITLLFSTELVEEFLAVVGRPKFKKYFNEEDVNALMTQIDNFGELVEVTSQTDICRDSKDNFLLNLSIDGNADFLVTGDEDLLVLKEINSTKIMTWTKFILFF